MRRSPGQSPSQNGKHRVCALRMSIEDGAAVLHNGRHLSCVCACEEEMVAVSERVATVLSEDAG